MGRSIPTRSAPERLAKGLARPSNNSVILDAPGSTTYPKHSEASAAEFSSLRFYMRDGPIERSLPVAVYLLAQAAQNGQPIATFKLAELLAAEAPEDIPVIIDAAALASLAYQELPDGAMKAKAKFLRDKLLNMLDMNERNVVLSRTINWPNC